MTPYPAYKASGIEWLGEIPAHWKIAKLKRVTQIIYGESLPKDDRTEGNVPVYGSNGITGYHYEAITKNPCIIIGRKGSFGKVNYSEVNCFPIDTTFYIDDSTTSNNIRWLYYLLLVLRLDSFSKDSAVPGLNREEIYERDGIILPLSEQRTIAAYLDHKTRLIDTYLAKKQQQIERLQAYRTALINQAVTKGLNPAAPMKPSGIEWLGDIPAHWKVKKLKYCVTIKSGQIDPTEDKYKDLILIAPNHIESGSGRLLYTETADEQGAESGKYLFQAQDVLYSKIRPHLQKACIAPCDGICSADVYPLTVNPFMLPQFLLFLILTESFTTFAVERSMRVAMPKINREDLGECGLPLPSIQEQSEIVEYINLQTAKIDTLIAATQQQLDRLHAYRTALISVAVTGKMDVRQEGNYKDCT